MLVEASCVYETKLRYNRRRCPLTDIAHRYKIRAEKNFDSSESKFVLGQAPPPLIRHLERHRNVTRRLQRIRVFTTDVVLIERPYGEIRERVGMDVSVDGVELNHVAEEHAG